jgi:hypothetical protein
MTFFVALVTTLMATSLVVSATTTKTRYTSKGYNAYASASYEGCDYIYSSYIDVGVYGAQSKFKQTAGENGFVQTSKYDDVNVYFSQSSCDDTTVTFMHGSIYDSSNYGDGLDSEFKIESEQLTQATLRSLEVPVYSNTCTYVCTEVCYAEIFGYGSCPPELPALECYTVECGAEETYLGIAKVNVTWKVPKRLADEGLSNSNSVYRSRSEGYTTMSRSRGTYRYDMPVTIKVTLKGVDLFPSSPTYDYGELGNTKSREVTKTKCIE